MKAIPVRYTQVTISSIDLILAIIISVLLFRVVFRFLGGNSAHAAFTDIYSIGTILTQPFHGLLPNPIVNGVSVIDSGALVALSSYTILLYIARTIILSISNGNEIE